MLDGLIPPEIRSRLRGLRLTARRAAGATGMGLHQSRSRGSGLEFAQYRAYEPGDELRQIDWKLFARSDRFFVREAERESPLALWILIDASASMAQADRARPAWSRLDAARALAACMAEIALTQQDRFGWMVLAACRSSRPPPARGIAIGCCSICTRSKPAAASLRLTPSRRCGTGSRRMTWWRCLATASIPPASR